MNDIRKPPAAAPDEPVSAPQCEEPTSGGSYTRNPITGALTKNGPAPEPQPSQE